MTVKNYQVGDAIAWMGGANGGIRLEGVVVERVSAKKWPKHDGPVIVGKKLKPEVSYIATRSKRLFWVSAEQLCLKRAAAKSSTSKPVKPVILAAKLSPTPRPAEVKSTKKIDAPPAVEPIKVKSKLHIDKPNVPPAQAQYVRWENQPKWPFSDLRFGV